MPKTTKNAALTAPPPPIAPTAPDDTWLRFLASVSATDRIWPDRNPMNKAMVAVDGASHRLSGLASLCWGLALTDIVHREDRDRYSFIARTLNDLATGLEGAFRVYRAEMNREDEEALRASRRGGK